MYFKNRKHHHSWQISWHFIFASIIILGSLFLLIYTLMPSPQEHSTLRPGLLKAAEVLFGIAGVYAVFAILLLLHEVVESLKTNGEKLDNLVEMQSRGNNLLLGISQAARLSDTAKEIVYRDSEQIELGEATLTKLHQHDFADATAMIETMAEHPKYQHLATRLKLKAEKYRSATEDGRINQIIAHINDLLEQKLWIQAAAQIENLIQSFPYSEKAKTMFTQLQIQKDRRKRELLADWDQAIRNKETDRSLEILKELDL